VAEANRKSFFFRLFALPEATSVPGARRTAKPILNVSVAGRATPRTPHHSIGYDVTDMPRRAALSSALPAGERVGSAVRHLAAERGPSPARGYLQQVAELIPPAWQFPAQACARALSSRPITRGRRADNRTPGAGACDAATSRYATVCYQEPLPGDPQRPFLEEEERLLDNIAEALGRVIANHRARQRINEYQVRLRSLASELALTGERERRRIAQQLHNEIGHSLALLKFKLGELRSAGSGAEREELMQLLERTIHASRTLTFELSPPVLHELGLGAALEWLAHQLEQNYGIVCQYSYDQQPKPLTEDLRVEVFQAVRELLTNVGKHSHATAAAVRTQVAGDTLTIVTRRRPASTPAPARRAPAWAAVRHPRAAGAPGRAA
jgi:signal transduction histidine kinase